MKGEVETYRGFAAQTPRGEIRNLRSARLRRADSLQRENRAYSPAGLEIFQRLVDLRQRTALCDECRKVECAILPESDQTGDLAQGIRAAEHAPHELLLADGEERGRCEGDVLSRGGAPTHTTLPPLRAAARPVWTSDASPAVSKA